MSWFWTKNWCVLTDKVFKHWLIAPGLALFFSFPMDSLLWVNSTNVGFRIWNVCDMFVALTKGAVWFDDVKERELKSLYFQGFEAMVSKIRGWRAVFKGILIVLQSGSLKKILTQSLKQLCLIVLISRSTRNEISWIKYGSVVVTNAFNKDCHGTRIANEIEKIIQGVLFDIRFRFENEQMHATLNKHRWEIFEWFLACTENKCTMLQINIGLLT